LKLVLVGKVDYFYSRLKKEVVDKKTIPDVNFLGFVEDHELDTIYHNAVAYVFPSLYEGFGLPPLEAMAKGTPVVSSDHPCMREVLGDSACYCDASNEMDISRAVKSVLSDESLRQRLIMKGYQQVSKYSWKKMARETTEVYKNIRI
jgi:glycosyltransferase involved in cell wall biosynthesis